MAKKEIIAFDPPIEEEIMLIQPNNVTFGQYNVSEWQENLLTLIGDKIQKHMTREEELPRDLFNQPYVVIMCDEAGGKNNKNNTFHKNCHQSDLPVISHRSADCICKIRIQPHTGSQRKRIVCKQRHRKSSYKGSNTGCH